MIGGRRGHPGPKMTRAEAVPAVRTKTSNKVPINRILFIFFTSCVILTQRIKTLYFYLFDVLIKLSIHDSFRFQEFKPTKIEPLPANLFQAIQLTEQCYSVSESLGDYIFSFAFLNSSLLRDQVSTDLTTPILREG
jgi:hypothetical protein